MSRKKWRKQWATMDLEAWEAVCRRCGRCCIERTVDADGEVVAWGEPCPYLEPDTHLCAAYERRFTLDVSCRRVTPRTLLRPRMLPDGCAYRALLPADPAGVRLPRGRAR